MATRNRTQPPGILAAELEADPEYMAMQRQFEADDARLAEQFGREIRPFIEHLQEHGLSVESFDELLALGTNDRNWLVGGDEYDRALPVLIEHLQRPYSEHVVTALAAAVGVPGAASVWQPLKALYLAETRDMPKERLADALAVAVGDDTIDELIDLIHAPSNGESRAYLLMAFDRRTPGYRPSRQARFAAVVGGLRADPELRPYIDQLRWTSRAPRRASPHQVAESDPAGLQEASANFETDSLGPFLEGLVELGIGFSRAFAQELVAAVKNLDLDERVHFAFKVGDDARVPLVVTIHMDDVDAPDVTFYAPAPIIKRISPLLERVVGVG